MLPRLMPQLCLGPGSVGDGIMQWEEDQEDLCLASSYAGAQLPTVQNLSYQNPFLPVLLALKTGTFPVPMLGWSVVSLVRGVRLCLDWKPFLILVPFVLETVKT